MNEWTGLFLSELLLIIGAVMIGTSLSCGKIMSGLPALVGMLFVFISVFLRLIYRRNAV